MHFSSASTIMLLSAALLHTAIAVPVPAGILSSDLVERNPSPGPGLSFSEGVDDGGSSKVKTRREYVAVIELVEKREPEPEPKLSFSEGVNDGGSSKRSPTPEPKLSFSEGVNDGGIS
ncbi:hypothetical protein AYL99_03690 [Fonsecaea erecta]|uniref:Uncharacterized protein n=1 Tax=Fonsecaea erecta TaxID=1367422 RepID=A0A178ZNX3_9EURO|nr:hypothetical protein AYL99_03690 [Fonsecaea erecta]OAP61487.1 hypothetical protein AYL99_03690 [Fonsecaea erecta]